ncbi:9859_t:CDS:2, partial [Entrophospora sp. SA101]
EKEKLKKIRPRSLAQAGRIAGINPTGLQVLEKTYSKLRQATTNERQISRFVNEAIEEKLARKKAEAEKELEQAYQEIAQDQAR